MSPLFPTRLTALARRARIPAALALAAALTLQPGASMSQEPSIQERLEAGERVRFRELGASVGIFEPGPRNAITDVAGVRVGHATVMEGAAVRTGVTAILPHGGNPYESRVPAALHVGNGFGKLVGVTQLRELGELETPILLTCTLCVWRAADALVEWMLARPGMENVRSLNAVVGETNDGGLNDIRSRPLEAGDVVAALEGANPGPVEEGSVGAGTGTRAFGFKGGVGTSSRLLPESLGGYTVGVLVQSNFGGILDMAGAPVGRELGRYAFRGAVEGVGDADGSGNGQEREPSDHPAHWLDQDDTGRGSIMMVVATDAPLSDRNLERLAARAVMGLARTGSFAGNGSGDYALAFSTHEDVRRAPGEAARGAVELGNDAMSPLFQAAVEATEEAIYNSLTMATDVTGMGGRTARALPLAETLEILRRHGVVR